jgi:hypothetical protein
MTNIIFVNLRVFFVYLCVTINYTKFHEGGTKLHEDFYNNFVTKVPPIFKTQKIFKAATESFKIN